MTGQPVVALPDDLVDLLRARATCYLSTLMPDGSPQVTQTWVDTDGRHVLVNSVVSHQRVRNVERDPRVSLGAGLPATPWRYDEVRAALVRSDVQADRSDEQPVAPSAAPVLRVVGGTDTRARRRRQRW